jgi:hypothetical protein
MKLTSKTIAFVAAAAASLATVAVAYAEPPANIANTTWTLLANRSTTKLSIDSQGGAGAPGAAICRVIHGTLGDVGVPIHGWYCPSTGRIHFLHNNLNSGITVRSFTGNLSEEVAGEPLYMAGTMSVDYAAFGLYGEYNFSATRQ